MTGHYADGCVAKDDPAVPCVHCGQPARYARPSWAARRKKRTCNRPECLSATRSANARAIPTRDWRERFWANVVKRDGCWSWTARKARFGYGAMEVDCKPARAHRLSWEIHHGPIPAGLWVLHKCDNPECANPDHLYLGTTKDNFRDMIERGRHRNSPRQAEHGDQGEAA